MGQLTGILLILVSLGDFYLARLVFLQRQWRRNRPHLMFFCCWLVVILGLAFMGLGWYLVFKN